MREAKYPKRIQHVTSFRITHAYVAVITLSHVFTILREATQ